MFECFRLFYTFVKLGFLSFGGGYTMLSLLIDEAAKFSVTRAQFADLNALDMIVPGPIAINASTYIGYLSQGFLGSIAATIGVSLPSFILTVVMMRFFKQFKDSNWLNDILSGIKPAAVGLIVSAAMVIASDVLVVSGKSVLGFFADPLGTFSIACVVIFLAVALLNIRFKVNPILLTVLAGIAGGLVMA